MKTEKRLFTLCLVVLMSLPLFGCGEDQGTAQAPEASSPAWEDESSWVLAQTKPCALTDEGFYFASENGTLCFADTSNGISVCLCSKPGCLHNTEWCDAIVSSAPISRPMFFWNHHIFYVAEDEFGTHVYRRNADGTAKTVVADLGTRYIEERMSVDLYYFAQSGADRGGGRSFCSGDDVYRPPEPEDQSRGDHTGIGAYIVSGCCLPGGNSVFLL